MREVVILRVGSGSSRVGEAVSVRRGESEHVETAPAGVVKIDKMQGVNDILLFGTRVSPSSAGVSFPERYCGNEHLMRVLVSVQEATGEQYGTKVILRSETTRALPSGDSVERNLRGIGFGGEVRTTAALYVKPSRESGMVFSRDSWEHHGGLTFRNRRSIRVR